MVAIAVALLFTTAALLAMAAKQWSIHKSFPFISSLPTLLCLGSFVGLLHNSNSLLFHGGFVLGLLSSVFLTGLGIAFIVFRWRSRAPVRKEALLTILAGAPMIYAVLKRMF